MLGGAGTTLHVEPEGTLSGVCQTKLAAEVVATADTSHPDGLLVFDTDGVTGHLDHKAASSAGLLAAEMLDLPVLGWTFPESVAEQLSQDFGASFTCHSREDVDLRVTVDRARQRIASHAAQASQALTGGALRQRLELLADTGSLRWVRPPSRLAGSAIR